MKSTDGGATWSWLNEHRRQPDLRALLPDARRSATRPTSTRTSSRRPTAARRWTLADDADHDARASTCRARAARTRSPGLMAISCSDATTCVASGLYVVAERPDDPEHRPADRHDDRRRRDLGPPDEQRGHRRTTCTRSRACPGTTTCTAVGRGGTIVTTTDLATWTKATSGTTNMLNSVTCLSTSFCMAVGQNGTVDVYNGTDVDGDHRQRRHRDARRASPAQRQPRLLRDRQAGRHDRSPPTAATRWTQQAGGGTTQQMNGISCPTAAPATRSAHAGTILKTSNGGQTWLAQTSGTTNALNGDLVLLGARRASRSAPSGTARVTTDGTTWNAGTHRHDAGAERRRPARRPRRASRSARPARPSRRHDGGSTWAAADERHDDRAERGRPARRPPATRPARHAGTVLRLEVDQRLRPGRRRRAARRSSLSGIACVNASACFADGAHRHRRRDDERRLDLGAAGQPDQRPDDGAQRDEHRASTGRPARRPAAWSGTGAQGDIMITPLLTVTVQHVERLRHGAEPHGPRARATPAISYSPSGEAANVTGTLTCTTTADGTSAGRRLPDHQLQRARRRRASTSSTTTRAAATR